MPSDDRDVPEEADPDLVLGQLLARLDSFVAGARPGRLARTTVAVDTPAAWDLLDDFRLALPEGLRRLQWYQRRRRLDGEPPRADPGADSAENLDRILAAIDGIDELVHVGRAILFPRRVRVSRRRLEELADALRGALEPVARALSDYRSIYPDVPYAEDPGR